MNEVRRCDEMERKLRFLEKEIKKDGIPILDVGDNPEAPQPREMIDLEVSLYSYASISLGAQEELANPNNPKIFCATLPL